MNKKGGFDFPVLLYRGNHFNANFYYFAKCDIDHAFLLLKEDGRALFVPKLNEALAREIFDGEVTAYEDPFIQLKEQINGMVVGVDSQSLSMAVFEKLLAFCKPKDVCRELYMLRADKNAGEVGKIARSAKITKEIFAGLDVSGMQTEADVAKSLLMETIGRGLEPAYDPIVATDRNSSFPHYKSGNAKIGEILLIDYAVKYKYYCADITRCLFTGNSKENMKRKGEYDALQEITRRITKNMREFETGGDIAGYSEQLFEEYGFPKQIHAIGHGVGLDVHESPRLRTGSDDRLAKSTFAIEPAVYFRKYGLRYEETVYFDGKYARIL